jgi:peptidoglycan LD-endopeptidase LytH
MRDSLFFFVIIPFLLNGCNSINTVKDALDNTPPYQKYVRSLEKADLDRSLMAKLWLRAGEQAMIDSIHVGLPFSESGYFKGSEPGARSYRFFAREGQVLTAAGSVVAKESTRFFLDLFVKENQQWKAIAHGDSTFNLAYEFNGQEQQYLIRIQPELLASVYYTFSLSCAWLCIAGRNKQIRWQGGMGYRFETREFLLLRAS